jgi:simple sugar transport system substrate-binding protein
MLRRTFLGAAATLALTSGLAFAQTAEPKTFYWISHGGPADPVWTYFLQGAERWADRHRPHVNTSFHSGDVPSQQEAMRAAIAAGADGICSTAPTGVAGRRRGRGPRGRHPGRQLQHPRPSADWNAYVGGDLQLTVGRSWAQYLVDNGHVESGDFVWMPVEVPGASYGVEEEKGIASVFEPLGITWEVTDATLDQAEVITRMTDYLTANRDRIDAMIGLGDMVTGSVARVWNQAGLEPGAIPVVGWGNSLDTTQAVMDGYVNAAMWQDPQATSYMCLSAALMETIGIPVGFDVITGALYEADTPRSITPSWAATEPVTRAPAAPAAAGAFSPQPCPGRFHDRCRPPRRCLRRPATGLVRLFIQKPEFGPLVLLVVMLVVFTSINPAFMSLSNIGNALTFTVELGLIALAMTLLMTSGEFDLSVGSVFGFSAGGDVDAVQRRYHVAAARLPRGAPRRGADRLGQRLLRHAPEHPLLPRDARHASRRARHGALAHGRLSPAHLGRGRAVAGRSPGRRLLHGRRGRGLPGGPAHLHEPDLVHPARVALHYVLTRTRFGNWIQADRRQPRRRREPRRAVKRVKMILFMLTSAMAGLRGHHLLDPRVGREPELGQATSSRSSRWS